MWQKDQSVYNITHVERGQSVQTLITRHINYLYMCQPDKYSSHIFSKLTRLPFSPSKKIHLYMRPCHPIPLLWSVIQTVDSNPVSCNTESEAAFEYKYIEKQIAYLSIYPVSLLWPIIPTKHLVGHIWVHSLKTSLEIHTRVGITEEALYLHN